ncbi:unnamed protein product [Ectocarpus sp. 12 AP-2014]
MSFAPAPSCSRSCLSSCRRFENLWLSNANWMASKKLDLPDPFLPTMTLCRGLKDSISGCDRKLRKPDMDTCLMCIFSPHPFCRCWYYWLLCSGGFFPLQPCRAMGRGRRSKRACSLSALSLKGAGSSGYPREKKAAARNFQNVAPRKRVCRNQENSLWRQSRRIFKDDSGVGADMQRWHPVVTSSPSHFSLFLS